MKKDAQGTRTRHSAKSADLASPGGLRGKLRSATGRRVLRMSASNLSAHRTPIQQTGTPMHSSAPQPRTNTTVPLRRMHTQPRCIRTSSPCCHNQSCRALRGTTTPDVATASPICTEAPCTPSTYLWIANTTGGGSITIPMLCAVQLNALLAIRFVQRTATAKVLR